MNERVQLRHLRREAVRALDDLRAGEARELRRETALDRFLSSGDTSARVSTSDDSLAALRDRVAKTARSARLLRRAVSESYRGMNMLESYVSLNMEAFRKIVKKHDKLTGWQTQETYMKGLKELRVFHDDEVGELRAGMESAYLKIEEVLCALEPDRWKQRLASGGGAASSAAAPGFYEVRKRRNQVLSKLREDGRMEPRTTLPDSGRRDPLSRPGSRSAPQLRSARCSRRASSRRARRRRARRAPPSPRWRPRCARRFYSPRTFACTADWSGRGRRQG